MFVSTLNLYTYMQCAIFIMQLNFCPVINVHLWHVTIIHYFFRIVQLEVMFFSVLEVPECLYFFFVWTVAIRAFTCAFFCCLIMSTKQNFINVLYHSSLGTGVWNYIRRSEGSINSSVILVHIELKAHIGLNSLGLVQNRYHHYLIKK